MKYKNNNLKFNQNKYGGSWKICLQESRLKKVEKLISQILPGKMLDIGCAGGDFSRKFIKKGCQVFGLEINIDKVKEANKKGLLCKQGDVEKKLPYTANYFDLLFAGELIEHIFDTTAFLKETHRLLKPKGRLILTTPNIASLENKIRILLGWQPIWVDFRAELSSGHIRAYTYQALKSQLETLGFYIEKRLGNFVSPHQLRWNDLNTVGLSKLGDWMPAISQDMIIQAIKL